MRSRSRVRVRRRSSDRIFPIRQILVMTPIDAVISTAAVPGRRAPLLVTEQAVKNMKPGSVVVDLVAETGGNCELTEPGQTVVKHDVTIVGPLNLASTMPDHASMLYAKNIQNLLALMTGEENALTLDFEDEVIAGACITRGGDVVNPAARKAAGLPDAPAPESAAAPAGDAPPGDAPSTGNSRDAGSGAPSQTEGLDAPRG